MSRNLIVGGGPAGLTFAFLNPKYVVLDANPMATIKAKYKLGPRYIQVNEWTENFFANHTDELLMTDEVHRGKKKIGYLRDGKILEEADDEFKRKYSLITRGKKEYEESFLSAGKNIIEYFYFGGGDGTISVHTSCDYLFDRIMSVLNRRLQIVKANVKAISPFNNLIKLECSGNEFDVIPHQYERLVNTIDIRKFMAIAERDARKYYMTRNIGYLPAFKVKNKHFYVTACSEEDKVLDDANFAYVYSVDGVYTRKTFYYPFYTVYETADLLPFSQCFIAATDRTINFSICNQRILKRYENLPIQIENSLDIKTIGSVDMLGRYAQWNHSIRFDTVFKEFDRLTAYRGG